MLVIALLADLQEVPHDEDTVAEDPLVDVLGVNLEEHLEDVYHDA